MRFIADLLLINLAALGAFLFRQFFGDVIVKQAPLVYWEKYLQVLLFFNIAYPFVFWLLGLYDKRQKRALLEEFLLIFGVLSTSIALLIIFLFLGRLWWISRVVLFGFWGISFFLLCVSRLAWREPHQAAQARVNLSSLTDSLQAKKNALQGKFTEKLAIVIVTHNSRNKIEKCLASIHSPTIVGDADLRFPFEIIVIDNASQDATPDFLDHQPGIKRINNKQNIGYAKAVNLGIKTADSEYILILNPDIVVIPGAIEVMLEHLKIHPKVGLLGCKLLNEDGTLQYSARRFLDLRTYLYRFTPLRGLMGGSALERYYLMQEWDHNDSRLVDWVLGGCMLARKKALLDAGLMAEEYFLYFEDVDLCFNLWEKGWEIAYVAEAGMIHQHVRSSANRLFSRATYEHFRSLFLFLLKHGVRLPLSSPSSRE